MFFALEQQSRNQFCKWPYSNNEYSSLSQLAIVLDIVGQGTAVERYQYSTSLQRAFESLLSQNCTSEMKAYSGTLSRLKSP